MLQIRLDLLYRFTIAKNGSAEGGSGGEGEVKGRKQNEKLGRKDVFIVLQSLGSSEEGNTKQVVIIKSNVGENYLRKSCPSRALEKLFSNDSIKAFHEDETKNVFSIYVTVKRKKANVDL